MSRLSFRVRIPAVEVKRRFNELPAILAGTSPDPKGLKPYFLSLTARFLLNKIHRAYRIKASGGTDDLGNSWRALARSTIKARLRPSFLDAYPLSAKLLILRVSDRLFNSLKPGQMVGNLYSPPEDQIFKITRTGVTLGTEVEYAKYQHAKRPLWPARIHPWVQEATDYALGETFALMARLMAEEK